LEEGRFEIRFLIPAQVLRPKTYSVALGGKRVTGGDWIWATDVINIEIVPNWNDNYRQDNLGLINLVVRPKRSGGKDLVVEKPTD
jgi:hypothetical protein